MSDLGCATKRSTSLSVLPGGYRARVGVSPNGDADRQDRKGFRPADGSRFGVLAAHFSLEHIATVSLLLLRLCAIYTACVRRNSPRVPGTASSLAAHSVFCNPTPALLCQYVSAFSVTSFASEFVTCGAYGNRAGL